MKPPTDRQLCLYFFACVLADLLAVIFLGMIWGLVAL